jgi:hypothetical protein
MCLQLLPPDCIKERMNSSKADIGQGVFAVWRKAWRKALLTQIGVSIARSDFLIVEYALG